MGSLTGFMEHKRMAAPYEPAESRVKHWNEFVRPLPVASLTDQAARCMDCGVPFCHQGCPLGNRIPDWNDHVYRGDWQAAYKALDATNNFPEFTGRICPAPCEGACVLGINTPAVTIKNIEVEIIDRAWKEGWVKPRLVQHRSGMQVAVVGSGPAGLAAADLLNQAGHSVTVFEKNDRIGGLLMYGIPNFKLDKELVRRRINRMAEEGVQFRTGVAVGSDFPADQMAAEFDAVLLAGGAEKPRDLPIPGRELKGVHFAMEFLVQQNRRNNGDVIPSGQAISAKDKHVVIIGGGDTGSDCLGTSHRQGAKSVTQLELMPQPPIDRAEDNPWPEWPRIFRSSHAHEEGGRREWAVQTKTFHGEVGRVKKLECIRLQWLDPKDQTTGKPPLRDIEGSEFEIKADLVLLAMGFTGARTSGIVEPLGLNVTPRGTIAANDRYQTNVEKVFAAGDMRRGQSLVVWAIREGREAARAIDQHLMGESSLPEW